MEFEQKHQSDDSVPEFAGYQTTHPGESPKRTPKLLKPRGRFWRLKFWLTERLTKEQLIIGGVVFVALFGGALAFALSSHTASPNIPPPAPKMTQKQPAPVPITSPLTGMPVTASQAQLPVTAVMIENSDFARPQSSLSQAGVVFEALTEGGITRFMALYQEAQPSNIGPVRSVRPYFLDWLLGFDAAIAHVGGSPAALADIKSWNVKDLNEFYYGSYYHRITARFAPHNMYTSMTNLNAIEKLNGWTTSKFTGFPRKPDSPSKAPNATSIDFNPSYADYEVHYQYDPANNAYLRWEGGARMLDANTGKQIEPKVVIAMIVPWSQGQLDATGAYYSDYVTIGSGPVYIFQDGIVTLGTWSKASKTSQIQFVDANNNPIKLNAGQTWITAVQSKSLVSYK